MPNLFSFVINMLNQISNDCKKTEHMHVQLKSNVSQEEKKERVRKELYNKAKERRAREGENTFFFFFLFPPNYR
jgi:cell division protein FtsX